MDEAQNDRAQILAERLLSIDWAVAQAFSKEKRPSNLLLAILQGDLATALCEYDPDLGKDHADAKAKEYFARLRWEHGQRHIAKLAFENLDVNWSLRN